MVRPMPDGGLLAATAIGWCAWGPDPAGGEVASGSVPAGHLCAAMEAADLWAHAQGYEVEREDA